MAFTANALTRISTLVPGTAAGATKTTPVYLYAYSTDDAAATVEAANYFNTATARLTQGSVIIASMVNGGTPILKSYIVTSATGAATVTVALQTTTAG